jgi:hypothetical protein
MSQSLLGCALALAIWFLLVWFVQLALNFLLGYFGHDPLPYWIVFAGCFLLSVIGSFFRK